MCMSWLKKLFGGGNPKPPTWEHHPRVALLFGINDYKGFDNDLQGCLNDVELAVTRLPGFQMRKFTDSEVSIENFKNQVQYAIFNAVENDVIVIHYSGHGTYVKDRTGDEIDGYDEALCLYDGNLIDDEMNEMLQFIPQGVTVLLIIDSCFSGTITRNPRRCRFMPPNFEVKPYVRIKRRWYEDMKWIVFSTCGENETSGEIEVDGKVYGVGSYFMYHTLVGNMTYKTWFEKVKEFLPNKDYNQTPTLEGNSMLINKQVLT